MKPFAYYKTVTVEYPSKDAFVDVFVYSKGEVVWKGPFLDYKPFADGRFKGMLVEKVVNEDGLRAQREAYQADQARLSREFKEDLFAEEGVTGNPKAENAYRLAWDYGHSNGYECVYNYFVDLAELIKD